MRHNELSTLEAEMVVERKAVEDQRDADLEARAQKLEADMKELEDEGAKSDVRRKVRDGGEREMRQLRDRAQRELDRLDEIWTTFTKLAPKQLIVDEVLYRELIDRYGEYFQGAMGAESIKKLIENFDIDAEAESAARHHQVTARARRSFVRSSASRSSRRSRQSATRRWAWCSTRFR